MSPWRRIRRWVACNLMRLGSAVLSRLVSSPEAFYNGMEEHLYADSYTELRKRNSTERQAWCEDRRPLLWSTLGTERTELMLARLERRIAWERGQD